jgi:hypothetical protein
MKLEFSRKKNKKSVSIKFHENPSSGSPVFPCGRTDRRTDKMKLIIAFHDFANAPKNRGPKTDGAMKINLKGAEIIT